MEKLYNKKLKKRKKNILHPSSPCELLHSNFFQNLLISAFDEKNNFFSFLAHCVVLYPFLCISDNKSGEGRSAFWENFFLFELSNTFIFLLFFRHFGGISIKYFNGRTKNLNPCIKFTN